MTSRFPIADQIAEAQRELERRNLIYPGYVDRGEMTELEMERRIALQASIVQTLQTLDPQPRLFGEEV